MTGLLVTNQVHLCCHRGRYYNRSDQVVSHRYLTTFYPADGRCLLLVVRCSHARSAQGHWPRVDGPGLEVAGLAEPAGPLGLLWAVPAWAWAIKRAAHRADLAILRLPDPVGCLAGLVLSLSGRPFGVEIVADAMQAIPLAKGQGLCSKIGAYVLDMLTRYLVRRARAVAYVSNYLRTRYRSSRPSACWVICPVRRCQGLFGRPRPARYFEQRPFKIICCGRLRAEKGHIYLVEAVALLAGRLGPCIELGLVGDGPQRDLLDQSCRRLGIGSIVRFYGPVAQGPDLWSLLDQAHLFVQPSLTEGLGRGLVEAMARGLPAIGSNVGGIPELLPADALFAPRSAQAIADMIRYLMGRPGLLHQTSIRNIRMARSLIDQAESARSDFWKALAGGQQP